MSDNSPSPPLRQDSRKRLEKGGGDAARRARFKGRSHELEKGMSAPDLFGKKAPMPLTEEEALVVGQKKGHEFERKTFFQMTYCHHCTELLWGIKGQGLRCKVCNFISHEKCIPYLKVPCRHVLAEHIQDPVAHKWTKPLAIGRKAFCNICRKRMNVQSQGVICEVCKFYAHVNCKSKAFNNCKRCATYAEGMKDLNRHHWIEGNLPSSAQCHVCAKNCATSDCLSSFRCGWCGITVHSGCLDTLEMEEKETRVCTFRDLWHMVVVPQAISYRTSLKSHADADTPEEVTDGGEGEEEEDEYGSKGRPCVVIDGSGKTDFRKWKKTTMHPTHVHKKMTAGELLSISLRKCGISDPPDDYFLVDVIDSAKGQERPLAPSDLLYTLPQTGYGPLRLYIRTKEQAVVKGRLKVNSSLLKSSIKQVSVPVSNVTTAREIVLDALARFGLEDENPVDYCLVEVSQDSGVTERLLGNTNRPWQQLQEIRKNSATICSLQRYYLRHREGGLTVLYIGGIPKDILKDKDKYTEHVKKLISEAPTCPPSEDIPYDRIKMGPAFPEMGGLFLEFQTFDLAMKISAALDETPSHPKVIMLPTIYPEAVSMNQEPLLVFVNGKSGGNQGVELLSAFRRHLNPHQVFDLMAGGGPLPGLYAFRDIANFRILIGGGDGTFGWVLSAVQELKEKLACKSPPCALLPLGTGNDLARALHWGAGYTGNKVMSILLGMEDADVIELDRWNLTFTEDPSMAIGRSEKDAAKPLVEPHSLVMNNYMGIGLDAAIALDFHLAREENPAKFNSRFYNKGVYFQLGLQKMISKDETSQLQKYINIYVDGKKVDLPSLEGVVLLNISSWGAGTDPWGDPPSDSDFLPQALDDGIMEVVGVTGVMHVGQIRGGIRSGIRLAQGKAFKVEVLTTVPIQVDGEAWPQPPGTITVQRLPDQAAMLQGPDRKFYSKQQSKKELSQLITVSRQLSEPQMHLSGGISSRRDRHTPQGESKPPLGQVEEDN